MALSGSSGYINHNNFAIQISWSASQNIDGNYSDVTAHLAIRSNNGASYFIDFDSTANINIGGNNGGWSGRLSLGAGGSTLVFSRTVRVNHNSGGDKSFTLSASFHNGITGQMSVNQSYALDPILRVSTLTFNETLFFGTSSSITINTATSGVYHFIQYNYPGQPTNVILRGAPGGGQKITIPIDGVFNTTNSDRGPGSFRLITSRSSSTWDGGNLVGFNDYAREILVPTSHIPTINSIEHPEGNSKVTAVLGESTSLVQGVSIARFQVGADSASGAKVTTYQLTIAGQTFNMPNGVFNLDLSTVTIPPGNVSYTVEVIDTRGRHTSKGGTLVIQNYYTPSLTNVSIARLTSPNTTIRVQKTTSVSPLTNSDGTNINTYQVLTEIKERSQSAYKLIETENNTSASPLDFTSYDGGASWDVKVTVKDKLNEDSVYVTVPTMAILLDLHRDAGIGIGKMHEKGVLDVFGDFYHDGGSIYHGSDRIQQYELNDSVRKTAHSISNSDLNSQPDFTGIFMGGNFTNRPVAAGQHSWTYLFSTLHNTPNQSDSYVLQQAIDFNGALSAFRVRVAGTWQPWRYYAVQGRDVEFTNVRATNLHTNTVALKDGMSCIFNRSGNIVTANIAAVISKKYSTSSGEPIIANIIPVGYRPTVDSTMILFPLVGPNTKSAQLSFLSLRTNGGIGTGFFNTEAPIEFRGTVAYITTENFPT